MTTLYCKAYQRGELSRFAGLPAPVADLPEDHVVYLYADHRLVLDPVAHEPEVLLDASAPGWPAYCVDVLGFAVPDYVREPADG